MVSGGKVVTTIPAHSAVALHIKAVKSFYDGAAVHKILLIMTGITVILIVIVAVRYKKRSIDPVQLQKQH